MTRWALIAIIALLGFPAPALAAHCGIRLNVVRQLSEKYGETRRGLGVATQNIVIEVWASKATGTWTILQTTPDGISCAMAAGEGWQDEPPAPPPGKDS